MSEIRSEMYIGLHVKYPLFLSEFNETLKFLDKVRKNPQTYNFMKIRSVAAELFHADRRTDGRTDGRHDEADSGFSQFCQRA